MAQSANNPILVPAIAIGFLKPTSPSGAGAYVIVFTNKST